MLSSEIKIYADKKLTLLAKCVYERMLKVEPNQYASRRLNIKQQASALIQEYQREVKC